LTSTTGHIKFGDGLRVTDEGSGIIRVDAGQSVGPVGPAGPPGPDVTYVHTQGSPSATWAVTHSLGKFPAVEVVDSGGSSVLVDVLFVDANHVTLTFGSPTSGKAYFN